MKKLIFLVSLCALFVGAPAVAEPITDAFYAEVDSFGGVVYGTGDGYNGGTWYHYVTTQDDWWSQWFYDHPPTPDRWKEIDVNGYLAALNPIDGDGYAEVAINYTTENYSNPSSPPLDDDQYIVRETIWSGPLYWITDEMDPEIQWPFEEELLGGAVILDYNPEWVSIDIRGWNFEIDGLITHECLPEPATLSLLVLGSVLLFRRRRAG